MFDPFLKQGNVDHDQDVKFLFELPSNLYDAVVLAVPHDEFVNLGLSRIRALGKDNFAFFDVKSVFRKEESDLRP